MRPVVVLGENEMTRTRLNESTRLASRRPLRTAYWLIYGLIILSLLALPPAPVLAQTPVCNH